ncbi:MAG: peptidoglycan-binding protein [Candidatus Methylomirabilales bacterium]
MRPVAATLTLILSALFLVQGPAAADPCGDSQERPPISRAARVLQPAVVEQIQEELYRRGYYDGRIDGIWGPRTEQAFRRFQEARGFDRVGTLTLRSLASLGIREAETGLAACRRE